MSNKFWLSFVEQLSNTKLSASKNFAEEVAWDFMETENPNFTLATVNPPMIFGPVEQWTPLSP